MSNMTAFVRSMPRESFQQLLFQLQSTERYQHSVTRLTRGGTAGESVTRSVSRVSLIGKSEISQILWKFRIWSLIPNRCRFKRNVRRTFFSHEKPSRRQEKVVGRLRAVPIRCFWHFPDLILSVIIIDTLIFPTQ